MYASHAFRTASLERRRKKSISFLQYGIETRAMPTSSTMKVLSVSSSAGVSVRGRPPAELSAPSYSGSLRAWAMIARMARALPRSPSVLRTNFAMSDAPSPASAIPTILPLGQAENRAYDCAMAAPRRPNFNRWLQQMGRPNSNR